MAGQQDSRTAGQQDIRTSPREHEHESPEAYSFRRALSAGKLKADRVHRASLPALFAIYCGPGALCGALPVATRMGTHLPLKQSR